MNRYIQPDLYKQIIERMPFACVDLAIERNGKWLMVKRRQEPAKGEWWVVGGRVYKNETLEAAAKRKAREEVGLEIELVRKVGFYETFFKTAKVPVKGGTHTVNVVFLARSRKGQVVLDKNHSDFRWCSTIEEGWHPYMKALLSDAGFQ